MYSLQSLLCTRARSKHKKCWPRLKRETRTAGIHTSSDHPLMTDSIRFMPRSSVSTDQAILPFLDSGNIFRIFVSSFTTRFCAASVPGGESVCVVCLLLTAFARHPVPFFYCLCSRHASAGAKKRRRSVKTFSQQQERKGRRQ